MTEPRSDNNKVCLGSKLLKASSVRCIPLRYNWSDYLEEERCLIRDAKRIYFPTLHYAPVFSCTGKEIFPSLSSYLLLGNKIRQLQTFEAASISIPCTRLFTGPDKKEEILDHFSFPFVAKIPVGSSRGQGVYLIRNEQVLESYLDLVSVAYIQEYIPVDKDIRVVVIGREAVLSYWKKAAGDEFKTNVAQGACIDFHNVPGQAVDLALLAAERCSIDHAGFDICMSDRGPLIFEANIHFGRQGFKQAGISYKALLAKMADSGKI